MIWIFWGLLAGAAVMGVSAWARRSRKRVDAEGEARREANRLDIEERALLAKLRAREERGED
jgi:hypothetical protein